jgi:hypothetical protein
MKEAKVTRFLEDCSAKSKDLHTRTYICICICMKDRSVPIRVKHRLQRKKLIYVDTYNIYTETA